MNKHVLSPAALMLREVEFIDSMKKNDIIIKYCD